MWDFQVGLAGKAWELDRVVANSGALLRAADAADVPVIWSRHVLPPLSRSTGGTLFFLMRKQGVQSSAELTPSMLEGSDDVAFLSELRPRPHDSVVQKETPSFFVGTPLVSRLRALGVSSLVLAGVATEIGIDLTVKHAQALGYLTVVASDAVSSYSEERHSRGLEAMALATYMSSAAEISDSWAAEARSTGREGGRGGAA